MKSILLKLTALIAALSVALSLFGCGLISENEDSNYSSSYEESSGQEDSSGSDGQEDSSGSGGQEDSSGSDGSDGSGEVGLGEVPLTFVAINDTHGSIEQNEEKLYGLSNTAKAIDKMSKNYGKGDTREDIVLFGNGDMFQGTAISNMSKGRAVVEAMNDMRFDGMGIGNHEFDWGIEVITNYFDGDPSNGEANFPLVNANIYKKSIGKYLADESDDDNIVNGTIVNKSGVKVGLIGVIGPCENSILATRVQDYSFTQDYIIDRVKQTAMTLKADGAQVISVNIHYGDTYNDKFAAIKENGEYLIDVIFNGHTHAKVKSSASRPNGETVPVVQGGANNYAFAYVKLTYNTENGHIAYNDYGYRNLSSTDREYDQKVEKTISDYLATLVDSLPVLAISDVTVDNKYNLQNYVAKIGVTAIGTDYFVSNNGGLRSNGDIYKGNPIKEDAFYKIIPFDNEIYYLEMQGDGLYRYYISQNSYNYFGKRDGAKEINQLEGDTNYYTIGVIDYVYLGTYFDSFRQYVRTEVATHYQLRDLLVQDAIACHNAGKRWHYNNAPSIGLLYTK